MPVYPHTVWLGQVKETNLMFLVLPPSIFEAACLSLLIAIKKLE